MIWQEANAFFQIGKVEILNGCKKLLVFFAKLLLVQCRCKPSINVTNNIKILKKEKRVTDKIFIDTG